jgi:hypothetical protein
MSEKSEITMTTDPVAPVETTSNETLYAGKYKTVEELTAAYEALTATATATTESEQLPATTEGTENAEGDPPSKEIPTDESAKETVTNAGLDWNALNDEYARDGKLSDDTYAALEAKGLPRSEVDTYIAGKQALADAYDNAVYGTAGGAQEYASLIEWAKTSLTTEEKVAFNEAVTSGDAARAKLAVEALNGRRALKRGVPPGSLLNGRGAASGVEPFKSQVEVTEAMRSLRYKKDPAFRAEVTERLRNSSF